ncbi:Cytochrome P450 4c3 [Folsomia candida]|uniref:Cytochrome P450 4c3 n=1 Tax=Folsomia candida TaxID=158441 RepID=A0A226DQW1_FOLCA|nr:Cytochrome P450 4c3 [Folsomia candida]
MENLGLHLLLVIWTLICVISYACMTLTRRARLLSRFPCPGKFPIVGSIPYMLGPIDDNGQIVPKGSQVFIIIREILRDPLHFPHPEVFNPDRFLPDECTARHPYAYIPFSAGPRNCLGMKYAMIQMKACLAHILRRFHVSTNQKPEDISLLYRAVLTPKPKLEIVLTSK